jgi:UDP-N-acetylmuramoyl-tripeptide--D-alanyl-D-alanine ligase
LLGGDLERAARALADLRPARGRGARLDIKLPGGTILLIDESYNANPASMRAALASLGQANRPGRRIAVLGDMLELGPCGPELHRSLGDATRMRSICIRCGPLMRNLLRYCRRAGAGTLPSIDGPDAARVAAVRLVIS